jgi:ABC-2 type transport system ATP-binding protein
MREQETVVEVRGLTKVFGDFVAVSRVDLTIRRGEIFGFLGPNGAGKSTTIKMLCGILPPSSGEGMVAGCDLLKERVEIKRQIGYMSQRFSLYEELSVEENIDFFMGVYNVPRARKRERKEWVLEMAGLKERRKAVTKMLPQGHRQRLALGCAIVHEPSVVFLDEPTSGVDPVMRRRFWGIINELSNEGKTIIVTTHYLDEAEYCNRLALMHEGKIAALGTPSELKHGHKEEVLEIELDRIFEGLSVLASRALAASLFGRTLHVPVKRGTDTSEIIELLRGYGVEVRRVESIPPSLEDVFVSLIEKRR